MNYGVKLLDLELGPKKSIKYKRLYDGMCEKISKKLVRSYTELELIKKFIEAKNEFDKCKPQNKNNEFFHTSIKKGAFNNYNLFFLMRDTLKPRGINVNLFTENGIYYIKTDNYLILNNKIIEIENHKRNDDFYVLSENLIYVNTYRRLSNIYKLIDVNKSIEYETIMTKIINEYHGINEILKMNYSKLDLDIIEILSKGQENYEITALKGDIFMRERKYRLAEEEYKKVLPFDKMYTDLYFKLGNCLTKQMKYKESLKYYLDIQEKNYEILFNIGFSYYKIRNNEKAIEYFTETILVNERCKAAYQNLCVCYMKEYDFERARQVIEKGIRILGINKEFEELVIRVKEKQIKYSETTIFIDGEKNIYKSVKEVKA